MEGVNAESDSYCDAEVPVLHSTFGIIATRVKPRSSMLLAPFQEASELLPSTVRMLPPQCCHLRQHISDAVPLPVSKKAGEHSLHLGKGLVKDRRRAELAKVAE